MKKTKGIFLGIAMVLIGLIMISIGFTIFLGVSDNLYDPTELFKGAILGSTLTFCGGLIFFGGLLILYLTHIGKIFSYMIKETSPGTEKISHSVGKGITRGIISGSKINNKKEFKKK